MDPKQTDFHFFKDLPHLRDNKIITDPEEALKMLDEINSIEKEHRTQMLIESNSRDIESSYLLLILHRSYHKCVLQNIFCLLFHGLQCSPSFQVHC